MNYPIIRYVLGYVLKIQALFLLLPCMTALVYQEKEGFAYLATALLCVVIGHLMSFKKPLQQVFYLKEGCVATALSWIVLSLSGGLPFWLSREITLFTDAMFETVSGFTTTGASILTDVEIMSRCSLLWRSFTNWIGGMGVLVFLLTIIPLSGGSHMNLMRAESPGPSVGKLVPKIKSTARILYLIYLGLTFLEFLLLVAGGMPVFDAIAASFSTAGTGGFGIKNSSMGGYSPYLQWVVTIFMLLFGVNFNAYYLILFHNVKKAFHMEEVRWYFGIVGVSVIIIFFNLLQTVTSAFEALTQSAFQVASIITTTGFSTVDFSQWTEISKVILVLLMFIGGCAGSTSGGIKVSRLVILFKTVVKELNSYIHPKSIVKLKMDGKQVEHEVIRSVNVYFITFMIIFTSSVLLVSLEGADLITSFTAVAATLNNVGPGLELVGPTENFGHFTLFTKWVLIFDMLAGRLELFPLLILFHSGVWKDSFHPRRNHKQHK
ncbi:MAG: TrkH family potassium uptake protein [Lachnospiraceae bacterium]